MSTLLSENFDGSGSLPSGWTWGTGFSVTSTPSGGITPTSGSNCLALATTGTGTSVFGVYGTADTNGGDLTIQANVNAPGGRVGWSLIARASATSATETSGTYYRVFYDGFNDELTLYKVVSGSATVIGSTLSLFSVALPEWYQVAFTAAGTSLSVTVQDIGSGPQAGWWVNSSGNWQNTAATAISETDSSIAGAGYYGLAVKAQNDPAYIDDVLVTTSVSPSSAALSPTEGHDAATVSGYSEHATVAATEGHDTGSIAAYSEHATVSATEARDAAAVSGSSEHAGLSATEGHDAATVVGVTPDSILTVQDGADQPTISGVFASGATIGPTDGGDLAGILGSIRSGSITIADGRDVPAIIAAFIAGASLAATERGDTASASASAHNTPTLAAVEGRDTATITGATSYRASMAARERGDTAAILGAATTSAALAIQEARDRGAILAVALGIPPSFRVRESGDVAAILGGNPTLQYFIYGSGPIDAPVDYTTVLATTNLTTWTGGALAPGTWRFAVRAGNDAGIEDNLDCVVEVVLDQYGNDVTQRPEPPPAIRAFAIKAGQIRVEWGSPPTNGSNAPTSFAVYLTALPAPGLGAPAPRPGLGAPALVVPASSSIFGAYQCVLQGQGGVRYSVAVKSQNAYGQDIGTDFVAVTAVAVGPGPVLNASAVAVV